MSKVKPFYSLASVLIVAGALYGCATTGGAGDEKITANVKTLIDQHPDLGPPGTIQVQTVDHVVYLNGIVSDGLERDAAESLARAAPGVTNVVDSIAVSH
jgi:osmotically-inducible protein OsmY